MFYHCAAPRNPIALCLPTPSRCASKPQVRRASKPLGTKGLATYRKAKITFTFHFSMLTLSHAFLGINKREMKNESGFSLAMASQLFRFFRQVSHETFWKQAFKGFARSVWREHLQGKVALSVLGTNYSRKIFLVFWSVLLRNPKDLIRFWLDQTQIKFCVGKIRKI